MFRNQSPLAPNDVRLCMSLLNEMDDMKQRVTENENGDAGTHRVSSSCSNFLLDYIKQHRKHYHHLKAYH